MRLTLWMTALVCVATARADEPAYPPFPSSDAVRTIQGTELRDPYAAMHATDAPGMIEWIRAQDSLAREKLQADGSDYSALLEGLRDLAYAPNPSLPRFGGDTRYYIESEGAHSSLSLWAEEAGLERKRVYPRDPEEAARLLVDFLPSPDGEHLILVSSEQGGAGRSCELRRLPTHEVVGTLAPDMRASTLRWSEDGATLYYATSQRSDRGAGAWGHRLGKGGVDDLLFRDESLEGARYQPHPLQNGEVLVSVLENASARNRFYRVSEHQPPAELSAVHAGQYHYLGEIGGSLYFQSDDAPDGGGVVELEADGGSFVPVVAGQGMALNTAYVFGGRILCNYVEDGQNILRIFEAGGQPVGEHRPPLGLIWNSFPANSAPFSGSPHSSLAYFRSMSMRNPGIYEIDMATAANRRLRSLPSAPMDDLVIERVSYSSLDGTEIPMTLVYRASSLAAGPSPAMIWAYGAYQFTALPYAGAMLLKLVEGGAILAMPNLRGGGIRGREWYLAGTRANKLRTKEDVSGAAEWLRSDESPAISHLAILGNSAGTIPAMASALEQPELYDAVILEVPLSDMFDFRKTTPFWEGEFGSIDVPGEFEAILQLSTYQLARRAQAVPPVLIIAGEMDTTAPPYHAYKLVAVLQNEIPAGGPVYLAIAWGAGHAVGTDQESRSRSWALELRFLQRHAGFAP